MRYTPLHSSMRDAPLRQVLVTDTEDPTVRADAVRLARLLRASGRRTVGLLPASDEVAIPPLALQLAAGFFEISGERVAVVDANLRWPGFASLAGNGEEKPVPSQRGGVQFTEQWVTDTIVIVAPSHEIAQGTGLPFLEVLFQQGLIGYALILVDLTGFERLGEHLAVMDLLDGTAIVGRSASTRERDLIRISKQVPALRNLGVILTG